LEITRIDDVRGFHESKTGTRKGGDVAGVARKYLEKKTGKQVVTWEKWRRKRVKKEIKKYRT